MPGFEILMSHPTLVVVARLDVVCVSVHEAKADPPLIIHRDRMLPFAISGEYVKPVARRDSEIINFRSQIHIFQLSGSTFRHVRRDTLALACGVQLLGTAVSEGLDHRASVTRHVTRGKRPQLPHNLRATLTAEAYAAKAHTVAGPLERGVRPHAGDSCGSLSTRTTA